MTAHAFRSSLWYRQRFGDGETDVLFNNSGNGTLHVPGLGLPVNLELKATERFAHGASDWAQQRLTAREMAMLRLVNRITDLPGWQGDVLACDDNETLAVLRQQALEEPLISPAAWEWCIAELRDKSAVLEQTGFVSVFDSASCIVKSDDQIPKHVLDRFRLDMSSLRTIALSTEAPNELLEFPSIWGSHTMDLVDPSLYPLTFGKTAVLFKGGCPTRVNPFSMIGQGQTASKPEPMPSREPLSPNQIRTRLTEDGDIWPRWSQGMPYRFSHTIQWMPCEVAFTDEQDAPSVKITSYINNLHPVSYKTLYAMIEKVISLSIKPWDEVLARSGRPRKPPRIRWYGVPWIPVYPAWAYGLQAIAKDPRSEEYQEAKQKVEEYLTIPNPRTGQPGLLGYEKYDMDKRDIMQLAMQRKHMLLKTGWTHPEPGEAFGYSEWKVGKGATAVVAKLHVTDANKNRRPLLREADHEFYTVSLQDTFRKQGLQVIVKLNSIELNPKSPAFAGTDWHIDGLLNEHIVASSMVCLSSINTTPASLSFRVEADLDEREHAYEAVNLGELASVLDLPSARHLGSLQTGGGPALQDLGSISLREGRLVAIPNVLQRRMEPFALEDLTFTGYKRFLTLYLVDPHYRVCSTRNVPPQQHDWWWDAAGGDKVVASWAALGVPQEVADKIGQEIGEWPMGTQEARRIMGDRRTDEMLGTAAVQASVQSYFFSTSTLR